MRGRVTTVTALRPSFKECWATKNKDRGGALATASCPVLIVSGDSVGWVWMSRKAYILLLPINPRKRKEWNPHPQMTRQGSWEAVTRESCSKS